MGTLAARVLLDQAKYALNDPSHTNWPAEELLLYLSDAQRAAVQLKPDINATTKDIGVDPGTLQRIPADGYTLLSVVCNMWASAKVEGVGVLYSPTTAIKATSRDDLDQSNPGWHQETVSPTIDRAIKNYVFEVERREQFYIWPALDSSRTGQRQYVRIIYAPLPAQLTTPDDLIGLNDAYAPLLIDYMLYRAKSKDIAAEGQAVQLADMYYRMFVEKLLGREDNAVQIALTESQRAPTSLEIARRTRN